MDKNELIVKKAREVGFNKKQLDFLLDIIDYIIFGNDPFNK